ncbi:MAG: hypothetical protein LAT68_11250 [Cyclobacteriaceae bacterium]|nr:hypothetical protein [Cyclobacteriaceae bacterium]MCH8516892.1 hypothetical protein [Cyclobacteriaceae bacterium]
MKFKFTLSIMLSASIFLLIKPTSPQPDMGFDRKMSAIHEKQLHAGFAIFRHMHYIKQKKNDLMLSEDDYLKLKELNSENSVLLRDIGAKSFSQVISLQKTHQLTEAKKQELKRIEQILSKYEN